MQSHYKANFSREMGCTELEWLGWLPAALGQNSWQQQGASVVVQIALPNDGLGQLRIRWKEGPVRRIALMAIPCLLVDFAFEGLDDAQRYAFMRRFDLYMQRGGG